MRWRYILSVVGILTAFLGLSMLFALMVGLYYRDTSVEPFSKSVLITIVSGLLFYLVFKKEKVENLTKREGMAIVTLTWASAGFFGALPFYIGGEIGPFVNAFFESVSGFTTTGSSILTNIEGVSNGLLFCISLFI